MLGVVLGGIKKDKQMIKLIREGSRKIKKMNKSPEELVFQYNCTFHNFRYFDFYRLFRDLFFFFFSSRRRHTRCYRDWNSDVCSSDLSARSSGTGTGFRTPHGSLL